MTTGTNVLGVLAALALFLAWIALGRRALRAPRGRVAAEVARVGVIAAYPAATCVLLVAWDAGRMRTVAGHLSGLDRFFLVPAEVATAGSLALLCLVGAGLVRLRVLEARVSQR